MLSVHSHWHPLRTCVVGRSYPPEFYDYIQDPKVRKVMYKIAEDTETDLMGLCSVLEGFGVGVLRPELNPDRQYYWVPEKDQYIRPPQNPRDHMLVVGEDFYNNWSRVRLLPDVYMALCGSEWPYAQTEFVDELPIWIQQELSIHPSYFGTLESAQRFGSNFDPITQYVTQQGNTMAYSDFYSANVMRIGKDLFFGTESDDLDDHQSRQQQASLEFPNRRCHSLHTGGHSDSVYFPVCPGLIIATYDIADEVFDRLFPDWEVVRVGRKDWSVNDPFQSLYQKHKGKFWVPGEEHNTEFTDFVINHLDPWLGHVEETVFDINILHIDQTNVLVNLYNQQIFDAFHRHGITAHVVNLKTATFWDGGIHCCSLDLDRQGSLESYL